MVLQLLQLAFGEVYYLSGLDHESQATSMHLERIPKDT
jgi:hypothetical protein